MKIWNRLLSVSLCFLTVFFAACGTHHPAKSRESGNSLALPKFDLGGTTCKVSADYGLQNLEKVHCGLVCRRTLHIYTNDGDYEKPQHYLYPLDKSRPSLLDEDEVLAECISFNNYFGDSIWCLTIELKSAEGDWERVKSESDFRREMQANGYVEYPSDNLADETRYARYYTAQGPIDLESDAFRQEVRSMVFDSKDLTTMPVEKKESLLREWYERWRDSAARWRIYSSIKNGELSMGCVVYTYFTETRGVYSELFLYAEKNTILKWIDHWAPNQDVEIQY